MKLEGAPKAIFRFDAGSAIGGGHALRCFALADAMTHAGWQCWFAVNDETRAFIHHFEINGARWISMSSDEKKEPREIGAGLRGRSCDLLVIDHYERGIGFERACRAYADRIMVIDDLADRKHDTDILLNQNLGREARDYSSLVSTNCRLLLGPKYALLRPQFRQLRSRLLTDRLRRKGVKKILISFGMSDAQGLSVTAIKTLSEIGFLGHIDLVVCPDELNLTKARIEAVAIGERVRVYSEVKEMAPLMADADLAIGGGGTMSLERCALGLPALVVVIAENQLAATRALAQLGAVWVIGKSSINKGLLGSKLNEIMTDYSSFQKVSSKAASICDGAGCSRVLEAIHA